MAHLAPSFGAAVDCQHRLLQVVLRLLEVELDSEHVEVGNPLEGPGEDPFLHIKAGGQKPYKRLDARAEVYPIRSDKGPEGGGPPVGEHDEAMSPKLHEVKK